MTRYASMVRRTIHDTSQAILLSMVVITGAWSLNLLIPHRYPACSLAAHVANGPIFGILGLALTLLGLVSLSMRNLQLRAVTLVLVATVTGLLAAAYLALDAYSVTSLVYMVLTAQSWWALFTLPVSDVEGAGLAR